MRWIIQTGRSWAGRRVLLVGLGLAALLLVGLWSAGADPSGNERSNTDSRLWALLIGVEHYQDRDITPADYCESDAWLLAKTLRERGGIPSSRLRVMTDGSDADLKPTRANILAQLKGFLKRAEEGDRVLVFFSGHGFRDPDTKKTYLAPIDCNHQRITDTAVELSAVRRALENSPATGKLLVLDACHAGGRDLEGSRNIVRATEEGIKGEMDQAEGVFTLASCKKDQTSRSWGDKKHGLFTYWLNEGLEGAADKDANGKITAEELFGFVRPIVDGHTEGAQTPASIVGPDVPSDLVVMELRPEKVSSALHRLSKLVHEQCLQHHVQKLGPAEFVLSDGRRERVDNRGPAALDYTRIVANELRGWTGATYKVLDPDVVSRALGGDGNPDALTDIDRLKDLAEKTGMDALLRGTLEALPGQLARRLNCRLTRVNDGELLASMTTLIDYQHNPDDFMFANSVSGVVPNDKIIPPMSQIRNPRLQQWMVALANKPHPSFDPNCPYQLRIRSNGKDKKLYYDEKDPSQVYVLAKPGELFELYVANRTQANSGYGGGGYYGSYNTPSPFSGGNTSGYNGDVFVRLWVDGLNVLDQVPELPEDAWPWVFPPGSEKVISTWHHFRGTKAGQMEFEGGHFKFVDPPESVAYRKGFKDNIGEVTAFFYAATEMNWLRKLGATEDENIRLRVLYPSHRPNEQLCMAYPLAWITIHYYRDDRED